MVVPTRKGTVPPTHTAHLYTYMFVCSTYTWYPQPGRVPYLYMYMHTSTCTCSCALHVHGTLSPEGGGVSRSTCAKVTTTLTNYDLMWGVNDAPEGVA